MRNRTVNDLMTRPVVHVRRDTGFKEIAGLLAEHDISSVIVTDGHEHPLGVVSEGDLLRAQAAQPDPEGLLPAPPARRRGNHAGPGAGTAGELMTSPAVVGRPQWSVVEAARVMERRGVKRFPVVDEAEQLVGLLSRADLLHVFLRRDQAIREEITRDVLERTLGLGPSQVTATVTEGRVTLQGIVENSDVLPVVDRLCHAVDGVVEVHDHLALRTDTTAGAAPR